MDRFSQELLRPVQQEFSESVKGMLEESPIESLSGVCKLKGYYQTYKKEKEGIMSLILEDVVNEMMSHIPSEFLSVSVNEIEIKLKDKKRKGSFKIHVEKSIIGFVSFRVKIYGVPNPAKKFRINIKCEGDFSVDIDLEKRKFYLNSFGGKLSASILSIPFMRLKNPILIKEKEFSIDFTQVQKNHRCVEISE